MFFTNIIIFCILVFLVELCYKDLKRFKSRLRMLDRLNDGDIVYGRYNRPLTKPYILKRIKRRVFLIAIKVVIIVALIVFMISS